MAHPRSLAFLASLASLTTLALACGSDFRLDPAAYCRDEPASCDGGAGVGVSGRGGEGGAGEGGGGAGGQGEGGGGSGGGGPMCDGDGECAPASGALCVLGTCTRPAGQCDVATRVVADPAAEARVDVALAGACFHRSFDEAFAAVGGATTRLIVYADQVEVGGALDVRAGLRIEGRSSHADQGVTLNFAAAVGGARATLNANAALKGVAVFGDRTASGLRVAGAGVSLEGPLRVENTTLALAVVAGAGATVSGTPQAPAVFSNNVVGISVESGAGLELRGNAAAAGEAGGVVLDVANAASETALQVKGGPNDGSDQSKVVIGKASVKNHRDALGAIVIDAYRDVTVADSVFENNTVSIFLNNPQGGPSGSFSRVALRNNDFSASHRGDESPPGVAVCAQLLSTQNLNVGAGNLFPPGGAACASGTINPIGSCKVGGAFAALGGPLEVQCAP